MDLGNAVFVTGAGVSVESGIQPFRGPNGIWEENPMEMASYRKYNSDPGHFLSRYYHRFVSCREAIPNAAHHYLAQHNFRVITQNVDGLHRKAGHPDPHLIEIHGCIHHMRRVNATERHHLELAKWDSVDEANLVPSLFKYFEIGEGGQIDLETSYRPHILLFDEYYSELYEITKAQQWVMDADTVVFMGTSNSVGITANILSMAVYDSKKIVVVDPKPVSSLCVPGAKVYEMSASSFCSSLKI